MNEVIGEEQCIVCGDKKTREKYKIDAHTIMQCTVCTHMWLSPQPTGAELSQIYSEGYFDNPGFMSGNNSFLYGYHDYVMERFTKQAGYKRTMDSIKQMSHLSNGRLLDVGCGMGYFLDVAHDAGFKVSGVEFNPEAVQKIGQKYVFPVYQGDFISYMEEGFSVITMFDVIEHFLDPLAAIGHAGKLLTDRGVLVITTMDSASWSSRLIGARLEDFRRIREHLHFFTRASIRKSLSGQGFKVEAIRSYGHTFELGFLCNRIGVINKVLGKSLSSLVSCIGMDHLNLHLNPMTKMIVYARKVTDTSAPQS